MKIAFHGSFGGEINPDYRDLNQSEASRKVVKFVQDFVADYFPGLEHENGPALLESCIYTVSFLLKKLLTSGLTTIPSNPNND